MFEEFVKNHNLPKYRIDQLNSQYYQSTISSWDELTTWSKELRENLKKEIPFSSLHNIEEFSSEDNRTTKIVAYTTEGFPVESVLMKSAKRNTICISCMSGCPVGCKFCATGQMRFNRNLTEREIVDQVLYFKRKLTTMGEDITNVVFMGMGEPMLNLENVVSAIRQLTDPEKFGLGRRRITVSTVGYIDNLKRFLKEELGVKLAISLHSPTQELRERLMPTVARENPLDELIKVLIEYQKRSNKKITYEYLLLKNINDSINDANKLADLVGNQLCLVNLINFNSSGNLPFETSEKERVIKFQKILKYRGIENTLRYSYGDEIKAACGQLANLRS